MIRNFTADQEPAPRISLLLRLFPGQFLVAERQLMVMLAIGGLTPFITIDYRSTELVRLSGIPHQFRTTLDPS